MKMNIGKLNPFLILVSVQELFACMVFFNELYSIWNRYPGGNYPIEHKFSWVRVLLFCGNAILSAFVVWLYTKQKNLSNFFPSLKSVVLVAIPLILISLLSNYPSVSGWCCEVFPTRYYGFPFSFIRGNNLVETFMNSNLTNILNYNFLPYSFFLNFLFWSTAIFSLLCLFAYFKQRNNLPKSFYEDV